MIFIFKLLLIFPFILQIIFKILLKKKTYRICCMVIYNISIIILLNNILINKLWIIIIVLFLWLYLVLITLKKIQKKYNTLHSNYLFPVLSYYSTKFLPLFWILFFVLGIIKTYITIL